MDFSIREVEEDLPIPDSNDFSKNSASIQKLLDRALDSFHLALRLAEENGESFEINFLEEVPSGIYSPDLSHGGAWPSEYTRQEEKEWMDRRLDLADYPLSDQYFEVMLSDKYTDEYKEEYSDFFFDLEQRARARSMVDDSYSVDHVGFRYTAGVGVTMMPNWVSSSITSNC